MAQSTIKHDHPACKTDVAHRHEKAYVSNSAGGDITEGCEEHYDERIVEEDNAYDIVDSVHELSDMAHYFVMSEILGEPKYKNTWRKR